MMRRCEGGEAVGQRARSTQTGSHSGRSVSRGWSVRLVRSFRYGTPWQFSQLARPENVVGSDIIYRAHRYLPSPPLCCRPWDLFNEFSVRTFLEVCACPNLSEIMPLCSEPGWPASRRLAFSPTTSAR